MGYAIDTVGCFSTQAGAGAFPQALAAFPGDSLIVRGTRGESKAHLEALIYASNATGQKMRVISPLLHDNVTGLTFTPGENPMLFGIPLEASVELNEQDTLTVQGSSGAATTITAGLVISYEDLRGVSAELFRWSDIRDDIRFIKAVEVDLNAIAVGAWTDTLITTTENQLHADASYAVLGWDVNQSVDLIGIKGVATGNLRLCGPGGPTTLDFTDYFIQGSVEGNQPYIPVFQANDRTAVFVSAANHAAIGGAAAIVTLIVAQLRTKR